MILVVFIYSALVDDNNNILGFYSFDTALKKDILLHSLSTNIYGVRKENNKYRYTGYRYIIRCNQRGEVDREGYTVVGKMIQNKSEKYLLISGKGLKGSCTKAELLKLNAEGRITNLVKSQSQIRLMVGSIPSFTKEKTNSISIKKDTITNIGGSLSSLGGTPGVAKKFIARRMSDNRVGIAKQSLSSNKYDNINEVVCYELGNLLGIRVCEASSEIYKGANDWVISLFEYPYKNDMKSAGSIFKIDTFTKEFSVSKIQSMFGKQAVEDFNRMIIFDTITRQTDRHINNFAFITNGMYPLYDNGRCLFWDTAELNDISDWEIVNTFQTNEHGYGWQYIDSVLGANQCRRLINTNVKYSDIHNILIKYYNSARAEVLSSYIYRVYNIILGRTFN